jgi:hypothetical protein
MKQLAFRNLVGMAKAAHGEKSQLLEGNIA